MIDKKYYSIIVSHLGFYFDDESPEIFDEKIEELKEHYHEAFAIGFSLQQKMWRETKEALDAFLAQADDAELRILIRTAIHPAFYPDSDRAFLQHIYDDIFYSPSRANVPPDSAATAPHPPTHPRAVDRFDFKEL